MNRALLIAKKTMTQVDAYIFTLTGVEEHLNIDLLTAKSLIGEGSITFLCPSEWISFIDIVLPEVKPSLLPVIIPNLVEESLAEPIESVHWAIASHRQDKHGKVTVAIVNRSHIENILAMCRTAGLTLTALYPDIYLVPVLENGWACWVSDERMFVRQDEYHGFILLKSESENWFASLPVPEKIVSYGEGLQPDVKEWAAQLMKESSAINLLQGDFARVVRKTDTNRLKKSLYVLGAACIAYFVFLGTEAIVLSQRLSGFQAETLSLYQQVIPGATQATSPRVVLTREMERRGDRDHAFFVLLSTLSQALSRSPGIMLMHMQYEGDQLSATVEAKDFETLDAWTQALSEDKLIFKQEGAEQENGRVSARIRLED